MILSSKILKFYESYIITACRSVGMLAIAGLTIFLQPFNYRRIDLYSMTISIIYIFIIFVSELPISKFSMMITIASFAFLLLISILILQYKFSWIFPQMLSFQKSHNIDGMIRFQFSKDGDLFHEGLAKEEFLEKIQHRLQHRIQVEDTNQTEIFESQIRVKTK